VERVRLGDVEERESYWTDRREKEVEDRDRKKSEGEV
jgi:hypothetical protein